MYLHLSLFHHYLSINMFFWDANQVDEERKRNALPRNGNLNVGFRRHTCDFSVVPVWYLQLSVSEICWCQTSTKSTKTSRDLATHSLNYLQNHEHNLNLHGCVSRCITKCSERLPKSPFLIGNWIFLRVFLDTPPKKNSGEKFQIFCMFNPGEMVDLRIFFQIGWWKTTN